MGSTIESHCLELALSCGIRNRFLCDSSSSTPSNFITFKSLSYSLALSLSIVPNVKGYLRQSARERSVRNGSVICMAKKYAPNTTKRKRLSRKRGGDPTNKKKTRRKGGRNKIKIVRLSSTAGTGFFYTKKKSKKMSDNGSKKGKMSDNGSKKDKKKSDKIELQKYDPLAKRHVLFTEVK